MLTRVGSPRGLRAGAVLAAAFFLLAGAGAAQAQTATKLVSNTGQTDGATSNDTKFTLDHAQAFTTGSHAGGYTLTRVDVPLTSTEANAPVPSLSVKIHSATASSGPGTTVLGTLTNPNPVTSSTSGSTNSFTHTGIDLAANTTFFVVIDISDQGNGHGKNSVDDTDLDSEDSGAATTSGTFEASQTPSDLGVTVSPAVTGYGFWAEHGFAALVLGAGTASVGVDGTTLSGDFSLAQAWAAGDATGTNPAGAGRATWTGIAEAAAVGTFERLQGTATVTIADLSRPRVGVAIDVPGHDIGAPGWADMALEDGRFATGTSGVDSLAGHFHGPAHEEVWGVFDTAGHVGAFGAKRTP